MTTTRFAESVKAPEVCVAVLAMLSMGPVTLVVAVALLVMVVLERSRMFPVSVKV